MSLSLSFISPSSKLKRWNNIMSEAIIMRRSGGSNSYRKKLITEVITDNMSWVMPSNIKDNKVYVRIFGGGQASRKDTTSMTFGGSGVFMNNGELTITPGTSVSITIGAGGSSPGQAGGTSSFGSYLSANGGSSNGGGSTGYREWSGWSGVCIAYQFGAGGGYACDGGTYGGGGSCGGNGGTYGGGGGGKGGTYGGDAGNNGTNTSTWTNVFIDDNNMYLRGWGRKGSTAEYWTNNSLYQIVSNSSSGGGGFGGNGGNSVIMQYGSRSYYGGGGGYGSNGGPTNIGDFEQWQYSGSGGGGGYGKTAKGGSNHGGGGGYYSKGGNGSVSTDGTGGGGGGYGPGGSGESSGGYGAGGGGHNQCGGSGICIIQYYSK